MARKAEAVRTFNVAVVGLSGTEKEKGNAGVGKSCLCNRFLRPLADEYYTDHISVLSQTDFSGRVVNNDHFLYWGEVTKTSDEGVDFHFQIVEQTEFIDDASFQAFKGGKMDPYIKRCSATKLSSAEKLMYICKNQLGIEKEYEQKVLPDGRFGVDGFVCCFDVSDVQNRSLEKQVDHTVAILNGLMKTKKPVVLVTTKNDEATESHQREVEKLLARKEFKGSIPVVETSAHENVNVELAFIIVAQAIDRTRGRAKIVSFVDAARARREVLDVATEAFLTLIKRQVTDYRVSWNATYKRLQQHHDFVHYCELFAQEKALREFRRHIKRLKEEFVHKKKQTYLSVLPEVLHELLPDLSSVVNSDWASVRQQLKENSEFGQYFVECPEDTPWQDSDHLDSMDTRIPFDMLETPEAETCFRNHVNDLQLKERRLEMRKQFKHLLEEAGYVTPGKSLAEVKVLFMGRECFEALPEEDCLEIYEFHQKEITERARQNFQELLLEQADLFYQFTSNAPTGAITQDDIKEIVDVLQEDSRFKALDRLDQDRKLMLLRHLGFVHYPIKEHCPAFPCCMDCLIENVITSKANRINALTHSNQWLFNTDSNQLNLVLLGSGGIAEALANEIKVHCEDDEYELDNVLYTLEYRIISGDVSLPQNSFQTADFFPHGLQKKEPLRGCFCVYSTTESYEYVRDSLEKTLLANLEQDDRLPFQGLPMVILFVADSSLSEKDLLYLREEGQNLSDSLQCQFIDITEEGSGENLVFSEAQLSHALHTLVESIQHRVGTMTIYRTQPQIAEPDIRVIMCLLCGDPFTVENMLGPILNHQCCIVVSHRSILLETYLGDSKRRVEVIVSSYHGANAFRDELIHGFILVYSTKRKASLSTLSTFSNNIPNLPIQILAVTDSGGANAFFSNDLSHSLITDGNAVADRIQARFMTSASSSEQKTAALYIPFFKEVWDKKPEIEQAFNMDDSSHDQIEHMSGDADDIMDPKGLTHRTDTLNKHRASSMDGSADSESHYERMPMDGSMAEDMEEPPSPSFVDDLEAPLVPSDDSDVYQNVLSHENGEHFVKPSQLPRRKSLHDHFATCKLPLPPSAPLGHLGHPLDTVSCGSTAAIGIPLPSTLEVPSSAGFTTLHHFMVSATFSYTSDTVPVPNPVSVGRHGSLPLHSGSHHHGHHTHAHALSRHVGHQVRHTVAAVARAKFRAAAGGSVGSGVSQRDAAELEDEEDEADAEDDFASAGIRLQPPSRGFHDYPAPQTPPEPAPPDTPPPRRLKKATTLPSDSHTSIDDVEDQGSRESLTGVTGWTDDNILPRSFGESWTHHGRFPSYTTGRRKVPPPIKPKPSGKPRTTEPGKLDLKNYSNVTNAIAKLNLGAKEQGTPKLTKMGTVHAPLATPESIELGPDYAQVKDALPLRWRMNDSEYATVHDAISGGRIPRVRQPGRREFSKGRGSFDRDAYNGKHRDLPHALTDSDSEWSSMERRALAHRGPRRPTTHKRMRRKRGIPVATPRVPPMAFEGVHHPSLLNSAFPGERMMAARSLEPLEVRSGSPSEGSDGTDGDDVNHFKSVRPKYKAKRSFPQKKKSHTFLGDSLQRQFSSQLTSDGDLFSPASKLQLEQHEDDSSLELLSPKDGNSRFVASMKIDKTGRRKDKQKTKEDEKMEKRRQKEEEKQKRLAEKKEEKEKKKHKKGGTLKSGVQCHYPTQLLEFAQSDDNPIPLFLEKCIQFIEEEGLDSEGIYRVPGNRAHVELLFQRFDEDPNVTIRELDIPVNAVATALKDFFSKRLPPLLSQDDMNKLVEISTHQDRSCRLLDLGKLLKKLPAVSNEILKYVFQHLVRVSENCKLNSMDSKNLAICWWPTLLPIEFTDMGVFERMRPHLEDAVQTMIDQFRFLFCDQEDVVMV